MDILCLDWDGTLVEPFTSTPLPGAIAALARLPQDTKIVIVSNQAGPTWRRLTGDVAKYPTESDVLNTFVAGLEALKLRPALILLATAVASTPLTELDQDAAFQAAQVFRRMVFPELPPVNVKSTPQFRKPEPGFLVFVATWFQVPVADLLFVGDFGSDEAAADRAGCRFQWASDWWEGKE